MAANKNIILLFILGAIVVFAFTSFQGGEQVGDEIYTDSTLTRNISSDKVTYTIDAEDTEYVVIIEEQLEGQCSFSNDEKEYKSVITSPIRMTSAGLNVYGDCSISGSYIYVNKNGRSIKQIQEVEI